jgi:hypothetical protein
LIIVAQVFFKDSGVHISANTLFATELLKLFYCLIIKIFSVDHEYYLVNKINICRYLRSFETRQCFTAACRVPNKPAGIYCTNSLVLLRAFYFSYNLFCRYNLIWPHNQKKFIDREDAVFG